MSSLLSGYDLEGGNPLRTLFRLELAKGFEPPTL